jgi:hypothetical protein
MFYIYIISMELAIPLIALGGMYVISNKDNNNSIKKELTKPKETFNNMGIRTNLQEKNIESRFNNYLPNTHIPPDNYPVLNNKQLVDNVKEYPNPNVATSEYLNQNLYQNKERSGVPISDTIQNIFSLSGDYLSSKEFRHNNMVPFNGGKPRGQIYNNNVAETILDNYAGSGSQIIKKIEQAPLFKPQENVQWAYGAPNMSEFYQSRVNPALKNHMVKPFESVMVGPGLDKGYTAAGSCGYNAGMEARDQWLPKTVDELRVATNPKEEYSLANHQGPAQASIKNVGIMGKMERYRPDTFFINTQDRWLTTTGAEKAGRIVADEVLKDSARGENATHLTGTPNATLKTASYVPKIHEPSKRNQLEGFDVGASSAVRRGPCNDTEDALKSHTNYENNRSINRQQETFGSGFRGAIGAVIAPIMDVLRPVRKEEHCANVRVYGTMSSSVPSNYVLSAGDVPNTTIKETTLYQPNGYIGNQVEGAYVVTKQQPISNQRDTTTDFCQINPAGGAAAKYGNKQYDYVYRQTNSEAKEKTIAGRTNQGNAKMFNPQINVTMSRLDSDRQNNRMWAPSAVVHAGPSVQTHGKMNMPQYYDQNQGCDRIAPDLLNAFKENPFTHSLTSAV